MYLEHPVAPQMLVKHVYDASLRVLPGFVEHGRVEFQSLGAAGVRVVPEREDGSKSRHTDTSVVGQVMEALEVVVTGDLVRSHRLADGDADLIGDFGRDSLSAFSLVMASFSPHTMFRGLPCMAT